MTDSPVTEQMSNAPGTKLGDGGFGAHIAAQMPDPSAFQIKYVVQRAGCCWCPAWQSICNPNLKGRGYIVIGPNFVESNDPLNMCCCCCEIDIINKTYFDRKPFAEDCLEAVCASCFKGGAFVTEHDTAYCCCCIPTIICYDFCTRPCFGGSVGRVACARDSACFTCATRCCGPCTVQPIFNFVADSKHTADIIQKQLDEFRAKGGATNDLRIV